VTFKSSLGVTHLQIYAPLLISTNPELSFCCW